MKQTTTNSSSSIFVSFRRIAMSIRVLSDNL